VRDLRTTVLDLLIKVKDGLDGSLVFRYACRMSICGACTVKINDRPRLACATKLIDLGTDTIVVEPVADCVVRYLVVDG